MTTTLDFDRIARDADLPALVEAIGHPVRGGKALCPFHDNRNTPALSLYRRDDRWRFKCHSCQAAGDAIDFRALLDNIGRADAARKLGNLPARVPARRPKAPPARETPPPAADWQLAVDELVLHAERALWSPAHADALEWVRGRGLDDDTVRRFRLGWLEAEGWTRAVRRPDGTAGGVRHRRGVLVPWAHPEGWYTASSPDRGLAVRWAGANVRQLADPIEAPLPDDEPKYVALSGSARGFGYPFTDLTPGVPGLILEGEFDAPLAWQELGHVVNAITVGGAQQSPRSGVLAALAGCPSWLIATDHDEAGHAAARAWLARGAGKAHRLAMAGAKDLGDLVAAGDDPLGWLRSEYRRLGWAWPLRSTQKDQSP